jgi:Arc/MetJ-type ribon-helix-helix transcriptional regulator
MGTRSVRLDDEAEQALRALTAMTGASVSDVLKRGVLELRERAAVAYGRSAWQIYAELDLGPGGYARAPARDSAEGVREVLRRKARRGSAR